MQKLPGVLVGSPKFKELCSQTILSWSRDYVLKQQPDFAAANERGELRAAIDRVLVAWSGNPNLGQGRRAIKDARIWLG